MDNHREGIPEDPTVAQGPNREPQPGTGYRLVVTRGAAAGAEFRVDGSMPNRCFAGKSRTCEFFIDDPRVSRRHFAFELRGAHLWIEDLDSTNGTWINNVRMKEAMLVGRESIHVGDSDIGVETSRLDNSPTVPLRAGFGRVVGLSPAMLRLYPLCSRIAASTVPVIIEGETGTGKELMAESLHEKSPRASMPFVVFDCTLPSASLVEAALFGHEKGAFTGADRQRKGVFEQASGGTLFIDEIGDLDIALQGKLLRAIQRLEIQRVGGQGWIKVDARIICATRRNLELEVQNGRFREDLFYRLAVARIEMPPLRRRDGDVRLLIHHFWTQMGGSDSSIPKGLIERLERQPWPGNVRELCNAVAQVLTLGDLQTEALAGPSLAAPSAEFPHASADVLRDILDENLPFVRARERLLWEFRRLYVARALERHGGNAVEAAEASGICRRYFDILRVRDTAAVNPKPIEPARGR